MNPESSEPTNNATLAILSGSKVMVWDLSSPIGDNANGKYKSESNVRTFDPFPEYDDGMPVSSLAWNHNQMVIATSSGISTDDFVHDNIVLVSSQGGQTLDSFQHDSQWKQKQQQQQQQQQHQQHNRDENHTGSAVKSVSFGGKSRYLCIGDESGAVCLWDLKKKIRVRQFFHTRMGAGVDESNGNIYQCPSLQVSLDPTDTYVLSLSPSVLYQYNLRDGQLVGTLKIPTNDEGNDIDVAHFTVFSISDREPNLIALGADDGSTYIHDITDHSNQHQQGSPLSKMVERHNGDVTGLVFSPLNPDILFSCGNDGVILVHNKFERSSQKMRGALDRNNSSIQSMSLHANGVTCAVGCKSGDVFVYDFQNSPNGGGISPTLLASFEANEPICSLYFAPPPRPKDKQRQLGKKNNETNDEGSSGATTRSGTIITTTTTTIAPTDSTQSEHAKKFATVQQQNPASPRLATNTAEIKTKARAASPFARKLASFVSTSQKAKQQKAAAAAANTSKRTEEAPLSLKKLPSSPVYKHNSRIRPKEPIQKSEGTNTEQIREVVREEVENLQDEMEEQLRNMHIDMINQFHLQSQEIETVISKHFAAMERLKQENQQLREENEMLRLGQRG